MHLDRAWPDHNPLSYFRTPLPLSFIYSIHSDKHMAQAGDIYERELKHLLCGNEKVIEKMIKTCDDQERSAFSSMKEHPFIVIRAAGSLGVDLVALRWDYCFPIEVKSSADDVLHFSRSARLTEQADRMMDECKRSSVAPIYAFRRKGGKGDPWRIFILPIDLELKGRMGLLQRRVPKIEVNGNNNLIMRWSDGMKLSKFIDYMSMQCE